MIVHRHFGRAHLLCPIQPMAFLMVALGIGCGSASVAWAEIITFVDSAGRTQLVDTENPGEHAMPAVPSRHVKVKAITFNVAYNDVIYGTSYGFDAREADPTYGTVGTARQAMVDTALGIVGSTLNENGTCDLLFFTSAHGTGSGFASGGTYFSGSAPLFSNGYAYQHITTNIDPSPAVADIALTFYFDWPWYAAVGAPGLDQYDLTSALLHEISRGLGLLSLTDAQGNSIVSPHLLTKWDDLLETGRGKKLWNSATALFQGVPSDLTGADGGVFFTGLYARLVFGGRPPIYAPPTFEPGSSMCYWNTGGKIAGNAVMEPTLSPGEVMREYALVDRGALKDIGYQNVVIPFMFTEVPQGGWYEVGQRLDLRVAAIGTVGQVTYQWQQDGSDVFEATSQHYVVEPLDVHDTGRYVCVLTDEAKAEHISPPGYITVFEQGTLPTTGIVGLAIVAVACVLAGAFIILRRG